jgi:hypothetical protein
MMAALRVSEDWPHLGFWFRRSSRHPLEIIPLRQWGRWCAIAWKLPLQHPPKQSGPTLKRPY